MLDYVVNGVSRTEVGKTIRTMIKINLWNYMHFVGS
jgi:hypothetical protein